MKKKLITASMVLTLLVPFIFGGCSAPEETPAGEGFAIYLTRDNISPLEVESLSDIKIADTPFVGMNDIAAYYWDTHDIELTPAAFERLKQQFDMPRSGVKCQTFAVCVDRQPVYWGAFWSMLSSYYFTDIYIAVQPLFPSEAHPNAITIRGASVPDGYPPVVDMRADPVIRQSLEAFGKLK